MNGNETTIPDKIISDKPLPIPFWVIWSPIHNKNAVPAVIISDTFTYSNAVAFVPSILNASPNPWIKATPIPKYLVILFNFLLPA